MVAVLKSQMSDRKIPIRSILDSYRYFFAEIFMCKKQRFINDYVPFYKRSYSRLPFLLVQEFSLYSLKIQ